MILNIKVIPGAKQNLYKQEGDSIKVYLTAPALEGRANEALIKFLSEHFDVNKSRIEIIKGLKSRLKAVRIASFLIALLLSFNCYAQSATTLTVANSLGGLKQSELKIDDPVYHKQKHYTGYWLSDVLKSAGITLDPNQELLFTALDGYKAHIDVASMNASKAKAFIAVRDLDAPQGWEKFQQGKAWITPAPYYLVWQTSAETPKNIALPWPYQMVQITVQSAEKNQDKVFPNNGDQNPGIARGYKIFQHSCMSCHSINLVGGTLGPELNVPRNILEYRDRTMLKEFIRDPSSFRTQSKMPAFKDQLSSQDLQDVLDYLSWMGKHKIAVGQ